MRLDSPDLTKDMMSFSKKSASDVRFVFEHFNAETLLRILIARQDHVVFSARKCDLQATLHQELGAVFVSAAEEIFAFDEVFFLQFFAAVLVFEYHHGLTTAAPSN